MSYGVVPPTTSIVDGTARLHGNGALPSTSDPEKQSLLQGETGPSLTSFNLRHPGRPPQPAEPARKYDSLDYEEVENTVYRSDLAASNTLDSVSYTSAKWLVCFAIGVVTALAAFAVNLGVENISGFKFWATLTMMERGWYFGSFVVYVAINASLVVAAVAVTVYLGPAAAGSGIADVKAYLNGIDVPGIFHLNTLVAKILGAVGSVAGGLAIGKEGPFVHAGAAIAAIISQGGSGHMRSPWFKRFWNDRDRNDMVACGAAAGVAAAFRSPVGGVLFALEEMTSWWRNQLLWLAFFTTAVVSVSVRVLMKACATNGCGFFGSGGFIIFEIAEGQDNYEVYELLPMLLLGVVGGLLGSSFIVLNARLMEWRKKHLAPYGKRGRLLEGLAISVLTSALSFLVPLMVQCQACPADAGDTCPRRDNLHSGNFVSFACRLPDEYNGLATLFFNTQDDAIRNLFSSKTKREYTISALLTFTSVFYFLAVLTYGIFCPTGLFVPSILCGASYGRLVGMFVADMHPNHYIDEGTYALLGAASFLGGAMRMTVCTCVMLLELTNNMALLPLIMLVLLVAKAVGDGTGVKPIYELQMQTKEMPFLDTSPEGFMRHVTAKECCGKPPITFQRVEKVRHILDTLRSCSHNGFPVMTRGADGERCIMGVVLRHQLHVLLSTRRCMQLSPAVSDVSTRVAFSLSVSEFSKPMSTPDPSLEELRLPEEVHDLYLDLGPYVNPSYYVVQEDASLSKVYQLFRTLGLRHICVIPRANEVVGIVTRTDLLPESIETRFDGLGQYTTDGVNISAHGGDPNRSRPVTPPQVGTPDEDSNHGGYGMAAFLNRRQPRAGPSSPGLPVSDVTAGDFMRGGLGYQPMASGRG